MRNTASFQNAAALFPERIKNILQLLSASFSGSVREIRLYDGAPLLFLTDHGLKSLSENGRLASFSGKNSVRADVPLMKHVLLNAAGASVYQYEKEITEGYITVSGGIRIGICCSFPEKGASLDRLTSLNIRIPYEDDFPCPVPESLLCSGGLLIAGVPGSGKTTVLKACCRALCDTECGGMKRVSIIDTRGELSAFSLREKKYAADIIACADKAVGIQRALRLMSPEIIVCDEIGDVRETESILEGMNAGVSFITAMHAGNVTELARREQFRRLCFAGVFENAVFLSAGQPGMIVKAYTGEELADEIHKYLAALRRDSAHGL